jgi:hypothetical protein
LKPKKAKLQLPFSFFAVNEIEDAAGLGIFVNKTIDLRHPDGTYDPDLIDAIWEEILEGQGKVIESTKKTRAGNPCLDCLSEE